MSGFSFPLTPPDLHQVHFRRFRLFIPQVPAMASICRTRIPEPDRMLRLIWLLHRAHLAGRHLLSLFPWVSTFKARHSYPASRLHLFSERTKNAAKEEKGQLPAFAQGDGGYLFDIRWEEGILHYETKWSHNTSVIVSIAKHCNVGFIHSYSEPGNLVYGEATYKGGQLNDISLDGSNTDHY